MQTSNSDNRGNKTVKKLMPRKSKSKRTIHLKEQRWAEEKYRKQVEEKHIRIANTKGAHMSHGGQQPMARAVQGVENGTTLSEYVGPKKTMAKGCRVIHDMCQNNEDKELATQEFDVVRSRIFNFHSTRSVIITGLKTKSSQKTGTCKLKIDTGSDGNLMPIRMCKIL